MPSARPRKRRRHRLSGERKAIIVRVAVLGVAVLVGALYYRPLSNYVETKRTLDTRRAEVQELRDERDRLEARLLRSATAAALSREARRLGLVTRGRAPLHRQGHPGVETYDPLRWMTERSSSDSWAGRRASFGV